MQLHFFHFCFLSLCFSDTVTSHVNKRGQTVYTNSGPSVSEQAEKTENNAKIAINEIFARHPEIDDIKIKEMILLRDHFIKFGNPLDQALLKAEKAMIDDGVLIDHEAVAAAKEAAQRQSAAKEAEEENTAAAKRKKRRHEYGASDMPAAGGYGASYAPAAGAG